MLEKLAIALVGGLAVAVFFRQFFMSGGAWIAGDPADGQLIQCLHEHWWRVVRGMESWRDLGMFYPLQNTLGYSDTFLLMGILHSGLRWLGLDPLLAFQWVQIVVAATGYTSLVIWLQRWRQMPAGLAALVGFLFINASPFFIASRNSHIQLLSIWLFPVLLILLERVVESLRAGQVKTLRWRFLAFAAFAGSYAYSTFYAAFFFLLLVLLFCLAATGCGHGATLWKCLRPTRARILALLPGLAALALFGALFLWTYWGVRSEMGGRSLREAIASLAVLSHLFNHSTSNWLWGSLQNQFWSYPQHGQWELELGLTPLLGVLAVGISLRLVAGGRSGHKGWPQGTWLRICGLTFLLGLLMMIRVGDVALWALPYYLLPGSEAIRQAFRFNLALTLPALLLLAGWLHYLWNRRDWVARAVAVLVAGVVALEQIQLLQNANLDRREKLAMARRSPPPAGAAAFYAFGQPWQGFQRDVPHNTAAYLAQVWNIPTLNGRSGFNAPNWHLHDMDPNAAFPQITPWARLRGIREIIWLYDLDNDHWVRALDFSLTANCNLAGIDLLHLQADIWPAFASSGWSGMEFWGVWTEARLAKLEFSPNNLPAGSYLLEGEAIGFVTDTHPRQTARFSANGQLLAEVSFDAEQPRQRLAFRVEVGEQGLVIEIALPDAVSPSSLGLNPDDRLLGIGLQSLILLPLP